MTHRARAGTVSAVLSALLVVGCGFGNTDSPAATTVVVPSSARSPDPAFALKRAIIAIGYDAWAGSDPAALSAAYDVAIFHAPEAGPDEDAHRLWEAADPTSTSLVYQNFGYACDQPAWTTCGIGSTAQARAEGWLASFGGIEGHQGGLTAVDMGRPGYGAAWARRVVQRIGPYSYDGVFFDDVNVADNRLPNLGVPDGYASVTAYKDAVKAQLSVARDLLGGVSAANIGSVTEWEPVYFPADDMVGVADYTLLEFCGSWANGQPQSETVRERLLLAGWTAAVRGRKLWCGGHGAGEERSRYNDQLARIVAAEAVSLSDGNDYRGPFSHGLRSQHFLAAMPWSRTLCTALGTGSSGLDCR